MTTSKTYYWVTFTKVEAGTAAYTALPYLMVLVDSATTTWTVPSTATCSFSGNSIPIVFTVPVTPFTDVTMTMAVTTFVSPATDPSENITPSGTTLTFSTVVTTGIDSFACGATLATTPTLSYTLAGTDKAAYALSTTVVSVTGAAKSEMSASPTVTLVMDTASSVAANTVLTAACGNGVGKGYAWFAPTGTDAVTAD